MEERDEAHDRTSGSIEVTGDRGNCGIEIQEANHVMNIQSFGIGDRRAGAFEIYAVKVRTAV